MFLGLFFSIVSLQDFGSNADASVEAPAPVVVKHAYKHSRPLPDELSSCSAAEDDDLVCDPGVKVEAAYRYQAGSF